MNWDKVAELGDKTVLVVCAAAMIFVLWHGDRSLHEETIRADERMIWYRYECHKLKVPVESITVSQSDGGDIFIRCKKGKGL